ncbi:hypothetical protein SAMN04487995_1306 [Dyadobacter koreensis]|uniref:Uncharacterized protein n=1 Tax=Dyadobacter koreensis TaxID=408657 RepID=A0A1H6RU36_9BACT|nr:hypothetical protein SAMN04487995_1306 [Dyadobacter koreensis]
MISFETETCIFRTTPEPHIKRATLVDLLHTSFKFTTLYPNLLNLNQQSANIAYIFPHTEYINSECRFFTQSLIYETVYIHASSPKS